MSKETNNNYCMFVHEQSVTLTFLVWHGTLYVVHLIQQNYKRQNILLVQIHDYVSLPSKEIKM